MWQCDTLCRISNFIEIKMVAAPTRTIFPAPPSHEIVQLKRAIADVLFDIPIYRFFAVYAPKSGTWRERAIHDICIVDILSTSVERFATPTGVVIEAEFQKSDTHVGHSSCTARDNNSNFTKPSKTFSVTPRSCIKELLNTIDSYSVHR